MKSNLAYSTDNTQYARSVNGDWFFREHGYNGYGLAWSKWSKIDGKPPISFETKKWSDNLGDYYSVKRFREIGFSKAHKMEHKRLRLPD